MGETLPMYARVGVRLPVLLAIRILVRRSLVLSRSRPAAYLSVTSAGRQAGRQAGRHTHTDR